MAALRRLSAFLLDNSSSVDEDLERRCKRDADEVRRMMAMSVEVTHPTYLVALEAARADASLGSEQSQRILDEMEANRVLIAQPRFGPTTMEKARVALERYDEFVSSRESEEARRERREREEKEVREDAEVADRVASEARKALQEIRHIRRPEPKPTLEFLGEDDAKEAKELREENRRLRYEERRQRLDESKHARRGTSDFAGILPDAEDDTLVALACVVEAIFEKPDDERRRTLRCENETFKKDFTSSEILYAFGFERVVRDNEEFLVDREPDPALDLGAWSDWYDTLRAKKNVLDASISERNLTAAVATRRLSREPPQWAKNRRAH